MLICGSFIDFDHMEIPNRFSIGLAVVGVFLSVVVPSLHFDPDPNLPLVAAPISAGLESVLGLLIGSGVVLWIALLAEMALKKEAMGFGDVKLLGGIGAFVGWQGALFAIFGGAVIGTLALGLIVAIKKAFGGKRAAEDEENPLLGRHIPFGPMLSSGALVYTLLLETEVDAYFAQVAFLFQ